MRQFINAKNGAILLGIILISWSLISTLVDLLFNQFPATPLGQLIFYSAAEVVPTPVIPTVWVPPTPTLEPIQAPTPEPLVLVPTQPAPTEAPVILPTLPPEPTATAAATAAPVLVPDRIVIPSIQLDAPVIPSTYQLIDYNGMQFQQWQAPSEFAVGWQYSSATLGIPGNTVLDGHHNVNGAVFARLVDVIPGQAILVYSGNTTIAYEITNKMILPEEGQDLSVRLENARWLQKSTDERLTMITCWPQWTNTHRLIVVARPIGRTIAISSVDGAVTAGQAASP